MVLQRASRSASCRCRCRGVLFYDAFGLGSGSDNISTIDADGIALLGIQALTQEVNGLKARNTLLEKENLELEQRLQRLENLLLSSNFLENN